jgi:hypothetical protein
MRKLLFAFLALAVSPALAEDNLKLSANDISVRTVLSFKVADAVVQKMLPAGWELESPTAGPARGFNLGVVLIDYLMVQDPEGKPLPPRSTIVLNAPAKKTATGEAAGMVFGGFIVPAGVPGPYSVFGPASITIDRSVHTDPDGKVDHQGVLAGEGRRRQRARYSNRIRARRAGARESGGQDPFCRKARLLPRLPLRAGRRRGAQHCNRR